MYCDLCIARNLVWMCKHYTIVVAIISLLYVNMFTIMYGIVPDPGMYGIVLS